MLKVSVPAFKFEKANEYQQMYEEAFEKGEPSFDEKMRMGAKKTTLKESEKLPSLIKNDNESNIRIRSGKLKPLNDKLGQSKLM